MEPQMDIAKLTELFASGLILEEEFNRRRQELGTAGEKTVDNNTSGSTSAPKDSAVEPPAPIRQTRVRKLFENIWKNVHYYYY